MRLPRAIRNLPTAVKVAGGVGLGVAAYHATGGAARWVAGAGAAVLAGSAAADAGWLGGGAAAWMLGRDDLWRNPASLPTPEDFPSFASGGEIYYREYTDALRDMQVALATYKREQLAAPTDVQGQIRQARALRQLVRAETRAHAAAQMAYRGNESAKRTRTEWEKRARVAEAYVGADVQRSGSRDVSAWRGLSGDRAKFESDAYAQADKLNAAIDAHLDGLRKLVASYDTPEHGMQTEIDYVHYQGPALAAATMDMLGAAGLPTAREGIRWLVRFDSDADHPTYGKADDAAKRFYRDFPQKKARAEAAKAPPFSLASPPPARRSASIPRQRSLALPAAPAAQSRRERPPPLALTSPPPSRPRRPAQLSLAELISAKV